MPVGRYAATITQTGPGSFAVQQTKGKPIGLWVFVTSYEEGDPQAVYAANYPVVDGVADGFSPVGDVGHAAVWVHEGGSPFDPISPVLDFTP